MTTDGSDAWEKVARAVAARRGELGLTRAALAQRARRSMSTIYEIEAARRSVYRPSTLAALEDALDWAPGTVGRILDGAPPEPHAAAEQQAAIPCPHCHAIKNAARAAHRDLDALLHELDELPVAAYGASEIEHAVGRAATELRRASEAASRAPVPEMTADQVGEIGAQLYELAAESVRLAVHLTEGLRIAELRRWTRRMTLDAEQD